MVKAANIQVSDAIRRALFWQDLYSCLFIGTTRLVSHRDYEEFTGEICLSSSPGFFLPLGFQGIVSVFPAEFLEILIDLNALCCHVDLRCAPGSLPLHECPIDNLQYNIESRLVDQLSHDRASSKEDWILQACIFACFLVAYQLSTGIWEGCFIPEYCATQVMSLLERAEGDGRWEQDAFGDLLLWLLFVCGALAKRSHVRMRARKMIRKCGSELSNKKYGEREPWKAICQNFIWSSHSMEEKCRQFSHEIHSQEDGIIQTKDEEATILHPSCIQLRIRQSGKSAGNPIVGAA